MLIQVVEDELNAVESIRDFLVYFREDQFDASARMKRALARYTRSFSENEWPRSMRAQVVRGMKPTYLKVLPRQGQVRPGHLIISSFAFTLSCRCGIFKLVEDYHHA